METYAPILQEAAASAYEEAAPALSVLQENAKKGWLEASAWVNSKWGTWSQ